MPGSIISSVNIEPKKTEPVHVDLSVKSAPITVWQILVIFTLGLFVASVAIVGLVNEQDGEIPSRDPLTKIVCDKYASPGGSDSADGTGSAPFRTAQRLADSLKPGQTGCLRSGTYTEEGNTLTISSGGAPGQHVVISSAPNERATFQGRIYITEAADYVTVHGLILDGSHGPACTSSDATCTVLPSPTINGDHVHIVGNDISNRRAGSEATLAGICINVGSSGFTATDTLIEGNRIHDCGRLPTTNHDHGIYVSDARGTRIVGNLIYDNADRGIQLYPDADGTLVENNTIDGNGEGVMLSGAEYDASSDTTIENNIISNSETRWLVESHWEDPVGNNNLVENNCLWATNPDDYYNQNGGIQPEEEGFDAYNNLTADPGYVNRTAKDFRLHEGSPCRGVLGDASP